MRVLLVEDDENLRLAVAGALRGAGFEVVAVGDLTAADQALRAQQFACGVFDRLFPDGRDAIEYVHGLRIAGSAMPVLYMTGMDGPGERVAGFASGGDDYLVKPFATAVLIARVTNLARRGPGRSTVLRFMDIELDTARRETRRGGALLTLSGKEFAVLEHLMLRPEQVVTRAYLIDHCWDAENEPTANVVDRVVNRLRTKLHEPNVIHPVRGSGYRLAPPVAS